MNKDWVLLTKETKRKFSTSTWVPLRAAQRVENGLEVTDVGYTQEGFYSGCVGVLPECREFGEKLGWTDIGIVHDVRPHAFDDGAYKPVDHYQYNDKHTIGVELVFEHPQPGAGSETWVINPDLYIALRLVKQGNCWVRPEEDFVVVIREKYDDNGKPTLIEIKREFLLDYLAARGLALRLAYYRQRVENVTALKGSPYDGLTSHEEDRNGGCYKLLIREINEIWGGSWAMFRAWRTDVDDEEDAPVMGPEDDENMEFETSRGEGGGYEGVRIEGEFWCEEWVDHNGTSTRVRGDKDPVVLEYIVDTDGKRLPASELSHEGVGRWLWFKPSVVNEFLQRRGFSLDWYTAETGGLHSLSGYRIHFGLNSSDYLTVYAEDVARLPVWEQRIWIAYNVSPEGGVSSELLEAQVRASPANTRAPEWKLIEVVEGLGKLFEKVFGQPLYTHPIDKGDFFARVSRFAAVDQASLLRLAKELVRIFTDRLDVRSLRVVSNDNEKDSLRSNKLLEGILAEQIGKDNARSVFGIVVGVYELRVGDAHPTGSSIHEAFELARIDSSRSYLRQAEQLIDNYGYAIWQIGKAFTLEESDSSDSVP